MDERRNRHWEPPHWQIVSLRSQVIALVFTNVMLNFKTAKVLTASLPYIFQHKYSTSGATKWHRRLRSLLGTVERYDDAFGEGYLFCTVIVQHC